MSSALRGTLPIVSFLVGWLAGWHFARLKWPASRIGKHCSVYMITAVEWLKLSTATQLRNVIPATVIQVVEVFVKSSNL
jgi:hypothetical protein